MTKKSTKRRLDVMLSSTSRDLPDHREQATNGILRLKHLGMYPVIMETLGASLDDAISASLKMVDEAEIYVGIFAHRYGYIPDDVRNPNKISITEMEYRRAMERKMPVLIFLMSDDHPLPATVKDLSTFMEPTEEGKTKLKAFKDELGIKHVVGFYKSPEDLRGQIIQALSHPDVIEKAQEIAGTMVEDDEESDEAETKTAKLPEPPEFYADPPYTLTNEFIGRTDELRRLDQWANSSDPMMIVEAIGGMGKSAVTWQWVNDNAKKLNFDGMMWWSFYESGATMAAFVRHALAYITKTDPEALKTNGIRENFKQLQRELQKGRYLLVLDGLERVLVAYHRWNAAQMRDDSVEDAESIIKDRDIRACTDPKDDEILHGLLACNKSKFLLSSRLLPFALEDRTSKLNKGVAHIHLNGLHPNDALALVRHAGVTVRDEHIFDSFMQTFGYHSLLVKLIAGRINKFHRARGDFDRWYAQEGRNINVTDMDVKQSQTHILEYAFDGLDDTARRFLSQIAAFGDAVSYDTLTVFSPFAKPVPVDNSSTVLRAGYSLEDYENARNDADTANRHVLQAHIDEYYAKHEIYIESKAHYETYMQTSEYVNSLSKFDKLLTELEERGLLRWNKTNNLYDMHPVVRGIAFDRLGSNDKLITFERIRSHLEAHPPDDINSAMEIGDLGNTVSIYRALVGAEKFDEAVSFFNKRLRDVLYYNVAAHQSMIELLQPLFVNGIDALPNVTDPFHQGSVVDTLASLFLMLGHWDQALSLQALPIKIALDNEYNSPLINSLLNYANSLRRNNQVALVRHIIQTSLIVAELTNDVEKIGSANTYLLGSYIDTGEWKEAEKVYAYLSKNPREPFWQAIVEFHYAQTLVYQNLDATKVLDNIRLLIDEGKNSLALYQFKSLLGEIALQEGKYDLSVNLFEEAVQLRRKTGAQDEGLSLGGLAKAKAYIGKHSEAREIIESANFGGIIAAEVYQRIGETDRARDYAINAYKWAWSDGSPYVWWWALERAKAVLDALGEPYPDMPPFDERKIGKFPYQDEVEALIEKLKREKEAKEDGEDDDLFDFLDDYDFEDDE